MRAAPYYRSLILHNNAGPPGTAASLHAALAIHNVTLLEAPWADREAEALCRQALQFIADPSPIAGVIYKWGEVLVERGKWAEAERALATDPKVMEKTGRVLRTRELGPDYGFTDVGGRYPPLDDHT